MTAISDFAHAVVVDFEFIAGNGNIPDVVCLAYKVDEQTTRFLWRDELGPAPPYPVGDDTLFVCFTQAELVCHLALHWSLPTHVLDLNCELRCLSSGLRLPNGRGLLGFCQWFGIDTGDALVKDAIRARIIKGWPLTAKEKAQILRYGGGDVDATAELLKRALPYLDLNRALYRGEFSKVSALMEHRGVPIDGARFRQLADPKFWAVLRDAMVPKLDCFGVYVRDDGCGYHFSFERFDEYLTARGIAWPRTESDRLSTTSKTFEDMTKGHPELEGLRQPRHIRDKMRTVDLAVGPDDRNRTPLWPYKAKSGRTQPAASEWCFSPAVWMRNLIRPEPGTAISYADWSSMEFLIAAALSRDPLMLQSYETDPYLSFAKRVGAAPKDATKLTHGDIRDRYKVGLLAIQYGIGRTALAGKLGVSEIEAHEMIVQHRELFQTWPRISKPARRRGAYFDLR